MLDVAFKFITMLSDIMLNVSVPSVVMLNVVMLKVVAPSKSQTFFSLFFIWSQSYNAVFSLLQNKIERLSLPIFFLQVQFLKLRLEPTRVISFFFVA
jgi:hypothetical protein